MSEEFNIKKYKNLIKVHRKEIDILKNKIKEHEKQKPKPKYEKAKIEFKIKSDDDLEDSKILSKLIYEFILESKKYKVPFEYKIKSGSIEVILSVLINLATNIGSSLIWHFIKKIKKTNHTEITKINESSKELIAKQLHQNLDRSFKGIIEKKTIEIENKRGTQYIIRDNGNHDWLYNVFDNGDFRALP
jgi:hypothetical protein